MFRLKTNKETFKFGDATNGIIETGKDGYIIKATLTGLYFSKGAREQLELLKDFVNELDKLIDNPIE